jgi:hypothetical protein
MLSTNVSMKEFCKNAAIHVDLTFVVKANYEQNLGTFSRQNCTSIIRYCKYLVCLVPGTEKNGGSREGGRKTE